MNQPLTHEDLFGDIVDSDDVAIRVENVSKRFALFNRPEDRLKQMVVPRLQRTMLLKPKTYFKEFAAVENVSLTVKRGETIGIIGRNGSGKSTLLQMIVGTLAPTSGTIKVKGRIAALLELGAGFNPEFTGRENVYVNGAILGFSRAEMDERFNEIAAFAAIGEFIERPVKTYSSGMFIRLAFAVATAVEPDILVVDEALSVGDEAFQRKCFARIEAIKERGGTILFVSHGAQTIVQLCDRAVLLDGGEKILEGEPKQVVGQYQRLVNASAGAETTIRSEIIGLGGFVYPTDESAIQTPVTTRNQLSSGKNEQPASPRRIVNHDAYVDGLDSESRIEYPSFGAIINNIRILNMRGETVNILTQGNEYFYTYDVEFTENLPVSGFGMAVKTVTGLQVFGQSDTVSGKGNPYWKGELATVKFPFKNMLMPGTYFCNAGVGRKDGEVVSFAHRLIDGFVFKVSNLEYDELTNSLVNLKSAPIIIELSAKFPQT